MASKLLPLVSSDASELTIFEAILRRAKGASRSSMSNLFSIILRMGLDAARAKVDSYVGELTAKDRIARLIVEHPQYHTPKKELFFWSFVLKNYQAAADKIYHPNITEEESEVLFSVLAVKNPENLNEAGFDVTDEEIKAFTAYSKENFNVNVQDLKYVKIKEKDAEFLGFTSMEELKAFVCFKESKAVSLTMLPVSIGTPTLPNAYEAKHCKSPYGGVSSEA